MFTAINPPDPTEFAGKRVIVTGGSRGLGAAIAQRLLDGGAIVVATARSATEETPEGVTFILEPRRRRFRGGCTGGCAWLDQRHPGCGDRQDLYDPFHQAVQDRLDREVGDHGPGEIGQHSRQFLLTPRLLHALLPAFVQQHRDH